MPKVVLSDTSCLIALDNIGELDLLRKSYQSIIITQEVADEFGEPLPDWITVQRIVDSQKQQLLEFQIDIGEASSIALALELSADLIIIDDNKARQIARKLGLTITGTLGVIIKAKDSGKVPSIKPILDKLQRTNFRLSDALVNAALEQSGEK
jgi:predicted nucleic acid-binding protein